MPKITAVKCVETSDLKRIVDVQHSGGYNFHDNLATVSKQL